MYVGALVWHVEIQRLGTSVHRWRIGAVHRRVGTSARQCVGALAHWLACACVGMWVRVRRRGRHRVAFTDTVICFDAATVVSV